MRTSIIYSSIVTMLVISTGCQSSMPRWDWWRSASTSGDSASAIAQSSAPTLPSSVASSGVSAPTGPYSATTYPTTPASAYGAPNMASTTPASAPSTAGAVGTQTTPYNPYAYGPPAGAAGQTATQGAYAPPATATAPYSNTATAGAPYSNTATASPASGTGERYGATAASPPSGYQAGSRYDSPASAAPSTNPGYAAPSGYEVVKSPAQSPAHSHAHSHATTPVNTPTAPVGYRNQAPIRTADTRNQYNPVPSAPAGVAAPTSAAGTPYRPAGTGTYSPVSGGAASGSSVGSQPASYQQTAPMGTVAPAPTGQYNPATAAPSGSGSRYGGRY